MPNRLARETSPYLQQHADNPVDWYPWGPEALERAQREGKPILLSVGYSACHWCHVMAHESFEDDGIAALMNELFVNIKVDREERPDLDQIYQTAHQMLTQRSGGWPLTMFLMPDGAPFFGGTYFPKAPRHNLPGFGDLLQRITEIYRTRQDDITEQNRSLLAALARTLPSGAAHHSEFSMQPIQDAVDTLAADFDARCGGFGSAPKFPHPTDLMLLLRRHAASGDTRARDMTLLTLERMAEGGIYDQLGGGFSRYSVDAQWNIPHFEKMLYDNGPLLRLCGEAWLASANPLFARTAETTASWLMREMQSPEGGYYSALDADSEHEEGKFYVWQPGHVAALLNADEYAVLAPHYGLDQPPNFEGKYWHCYVSQPLASVASTLGKSLDECERLLTQARRKLMTERDKRIRPGRDEKILTSWNALMIEGMARAASIFGRRDWLDSARRALDFLRATMWQEDEGSGEGGRLLATCKNGHAHLNAYLDDYAFLLNALIELMQADFRVADLEFAEALAEVLLERFEDPQAGGFFFTSHDHERLIHRAKPGYDNATPAGNGVAAFALQRLAHLTGEQRYQNAAERTLQLFYPQMVRHPVGYTTLLMALEEFLQPPRTIILRGPQQQVEDWRARLAQEPLLQTLILAVGEQRTGLPPVLDKPLSDTVNAWACCGVKCLAPIADFAELQWVCKSAELL